MAEAVNIHAAKTQLSRLVDRASQGEEIVIAKAGKPLAKLVPFVAPGKRPKRKPGAWKGKLWISPDFDKADAQIEAEFLKGQLEPPS